VAPVASALAGGEIRYALADRDRLAATPTTTQPVAQAGHAKYRSRPDSRTLPDVTITVPANGTTPG
jgi:hypothetical protein